MQVLEKRKQFWQNSEFNKIGKKMISGMDFQIKCLSYSNWVLISLLIISMFVTKIPQYYCWTFDDFSLYFTLIEQSFVLIYISFVVFGFRYIYGIVFTELTIQYKLLNYSLENLESVQQLKKCVEHQILLNRYFYEAPNESL